jgi:hypothetical protein
MYSDIVSYCCDSYERGGTGGVARYDHTLSLVFPDRKFFKGPQEKRELVKYLRGCKNPVVLVDNHLSCDVPNKYPVFILHHGCAATTAERNPDWEEPWKSLCTGGQARMLDYRDPETTTMVSTSISCKVDFERHFEEKYTKFKVIDLLNSSELDQEKWKNGKWNQKPIVLGNWSHVKKGSKVIEKVKQISRNFEFRQLNVRMSGRNIKKFNKEKQDIYLDSDIFLQISSSEGNSFATLDALLCGIPIVASNVGLFYEDVPEDCFVKMDWRRQSNPGYVKKCLEKAWNNREELSKKGREWYLKNCGMDIFKRKWESILN